MPFPFVISQVGMASGWVDIQILIYTKFFIVEFFGNMERFLGSPSKSWTPPINFDKYQNYI
jgi:hypothetical protein